MTLSRPSDDADTTTDTLRTVEDRVLWLSTSMIHHANIIRPNATGMKVGGHHDQVFPADRAAPMVTVLDGHPHTLAFLTGINSVRGAALGVSRFGQVGSLDDVYRHHGIDTESIIRAALDLRR